MKSNEITAAALRAMTPAERIALPGREGGDGSAGAAGLTVAERAAILEFMDEHNADALDITGQGSAVFQFRLFHDRFKYIKFPPIVETALREIFAPATMGRVTLEQVSGAPCVAIVAADFTGPAYGIGEDEAAARIDAVKHGFLKSAGVAVRITAASARDVVAGNPEAWVALE